MATFQFNSITNPNSVKTDVKDSIQPYTFIEFSTRASANTDVNNILSLYKEYLAEWANIKNKNQQVIDSKILLKEQIIDLLKIITISYSTPEEQAFLANLNWDFDNISSAGAKEQARNAIYAALPIFVKRIKDIATFYKDQRSEATFTINRNKIRGTQASIEKIIFDKILNYLFNNDQVSVNYVQKYMNISIDNYIDVYSEYFDVDQAKANTCDYNDIDGSLYFELEDVLTDMLFDGKVYLREIPLIASLMIDLTQDCVGDKLTLKKELEADSKLALLSDNEKIALRKKLYQKYLGVDFYYLYKDSTGKVQTDIFIKADNPTNNLLNQQTADTPVTASKQLKLLKNIGLFFKPDKTSILRVNAVNYSYIIDNDKVVSDKIYIFPDPAVYGNVAFNSQKEYPFIIEYSFTDYVKNYDFGFAKNDPYVNESQQGVYAYYSRQQDLCRIRQQAGIAAPFSDLYNRGYIETSKTDMYGNNFALIKEPQGKYDRTWNIKTGQGELPDQETTIIFNGGDFTDNLADKGISADRPEWTALADHSYTYFIEAGFSSLTPIIRAYIPNGQTTGNGNFGLDIKTVFDVFDTALVDCRTFTSEISDDSDITVLDAPLYDIQQDQFKTELLSDNLNPDYSETSKLAYAEIKEKPGVVYISTINGTKSLTLYEAFPWWKDSYYSEYYDFFVKNVHSMDLLENVIVLQAKNPETGAIRTMFDMISYNPITDSFEKPSTDIDPVFFWNDSPMARFSEFDAYNWKTFESIDDYYFSCNPNIFDLGSDIFYVEPHHKAYFAVMEVALKTKEVNGEDIKFPIYYPNIFEIDLKTLKCKKFYFYQIDDRNEQQIESFQIPDTLYNIGSVVIQWATAPYISYSADVNMFMLTYVVYDVNGCPHIYKHYFRLSDSGTEYFAEIDTNSMDSTVYSPGTTGDISIITPEDNNIIRDLIFVTNYIVS